MGFGDGGGGVISAAVVLDSSRRINVEEDDEIKLWFPERIIHKNVMFVC